MADDIIHLAAIAALEDAEIQAEVQRHFHECDNALEILTEQQFINMFRLTKTMVLNLTEMLEPFLIPPTRMSALQNIRKVLTALRFFASGSYQMDIGSNINMAISQPSVSRCIKEVTDAINRPEIFGRFVKFPRNMEEMIEIRHEFYRKYTFPGVIGCIDCTHVAIYPPKIHDPVYPERIYVNRKGYHSINVQLICDSNMKILNVCARYSGSTNDSFIWNNSNVLPILRNLYNNGHRSFFLLGDSGYSLRPWMMTPLANVEPNTPEENYNNRQMSTRSLIERCNGILKLRFRCLLKHRALHYSPERASKIINACTVLHNMCIDNNLEPVNLEPNDRLENVDLGMYVNNAHEQPLLNNRVNVELEAGRRIQQQLIHNHFR